MESSISRRELFFRAAAGLAGGAIGWAPVEMASYGHSLTEAPTLQGTIANYVSMAIFCGLVGGLVNAAEIQTLAVTPQTKRRFTRGFVICAVLALPAIYYANAAFSYFLAGGGWSVNRSGSLAALMLARTIGWALLGVMLGAGVGLSSFSARNVVKGAAGGVAGGFLAGLMFDPIGLGLSSSGFASRLVGFSITGLSIGLFIGLVQELTKAAWLTVEAGRLRGRQFRVEHAVTTLGRAEENAVGLFGDPEVMPRHAEIIRTGESYTLKSLSPQQGVFVNGARIESAALRHGDRIRIGKYELGFHLRRVTGAAGAPIVARPYPSPAPSAATAAGATGPCLVDGEGRIFPLGRGATTRIGRSLDNDIVINHGSVSRHHANILGRDGGFEIVDASSRNGTFVSDRRVTEAPLADGDAVRLGDTQFIFRA